MYILPPDWMAERWTGTRIKPNEATDLSGIQEIGYVADFEGDLHKLATSGNYQHIVELRADCDKDALLVRVRKDGPACHLGTDSCFDGNPIYESEED